MSKLTIYGASDDLIEVEGDIEEEFVYRDLDDDGDLLAFSDGTILRIMFTQAGVWRIIPVTPEGDSLTIAYAPEDDEDNYSDRATLTGDIAWVVHGDSYARRKARA